MFNDDIDDGFDPNTDFHCDECGETLFDVSFCTECHADRCDMCGELIAKGEPVFPGSSNDTFCRACDELASQESAREIAERLAVPAPVEPDETAKTVVESPIPMSTLVRMAVAL